MKNSKRLWIPILVILLCTIIIFIILIAIGVISIGKKDEPQVENRFVKIFTQNYPTDILILGENFEIAEGLYCRHSDEITNEVLKIADGCDRQIIIISDYNDSYNPSVEELKLVAEKLNNLECDVYLVGTALDEKLTEAGILPYVQPEGRFMGYVTVASGEPTYAYGLECTGIDFNDENDHENCIYVLLDTFEYNLEHSLN